MKQVSYNNPWKHLGDDSLGFFRDFFKNTRAQITTVLAICLLPLSISTSVTVDMSRAAAAEEKLNIALKEAATLLAAETELSDPDKAGFVKRFVEARYPRTEIGDLSGLAVRTVGETTRIQATTEVPTLILDVIGWDWLEVRAQSQIALLPDEPTDPS